MMRKDDSPVAADRLSAIIAALQSSNHLTRAMRREILTILKAVLPSLDTVDVEPETEADMQFSDVARSRADAYMVHRLVTDHGAKPKQAACAVIENGDQRLLDRILRLYRSMKHRNKFAKVCRQTESDGAQWFHVFDSLNKSQFSVSQQWIDEAASRLSKVKAENTTRVNDSAD
jgi:hypothetical protein